MKLNEIMTEDVVVIGAEDTLRAAALKMRDRNIGFLPVLKGTELIGVLTDRDLVVRTMAAGMDLAQIIGSDSITAPAVYLFDDQTDREAAQLMSEYQIRRLVILDRNDRSVVGVVSLSDLATLGSPDTAGQILQVVSGGLVNTP